MAITKNYVSENSDNLKPYNKYIVKNGSVEEVRRVVVHSFRMSDVEDIELLVAEPLWKWQNSEQGRWIMKNSLDKPEWHKFMDVGTYGWTIKITALLSGPSLTEWYLRYSK